MNQIKAAAAGAALVALLPIFALSAGPGRWALAQEKQEKARESRTAYLRRIFEKDRVSYGDACRAVLSLIKGEHTDAEFAALSGELAGRGVVLADWELKESSLLTKGTLAYMICRALDIQGGVTMRIFGINRRYALRECRHLRIIAEGTTDEYITGREMIDVVTNATIYKERGHTDSQYK